mmetsp:Transcript_94875/g.164673  ORF Transcript_94875/g.164673 Transcript_94875/m.164673 type:complete len:329 (+) Transcript_94875:84-1070(+)
MWTMMDFHLLLVQVLVLVLVLVFVHQLLQLINVDKARTALNRCFGCAFSRFVIKLHFPVCLIFFVVFLCFEKLLQLFCGDEASARPFLLLRSSIILAVIIEVHLLFIFFLVVILLFASLLQEFLEHVRVYISCPLLSHFRHTLARSSIEAHLLARSLDNLAGRRSYRIYSFLLVLIYLFTCLFEQVYQFGPVNETCPTLPHLRLFLAGGVSATSCGKRHAFSPFAAIYWIRRAFFDARPIEKGFVAQQACETLSVQANQMKFIACSNNVCSPRAVIDKRELSEIASSLVTTNVHTVDSCHGLSLLYHVETVAYLSFLANKIVFFVLYS